ncbi:hypothetical protein HWV01_14420 [Moritella sp. 5]|uniref:hypothetical protein n=1 Tax=Moritella sp. 5 TaxID=2746231 RepID=UPI001BADE2F7|nr:hypothetical protein [Moritella sp. 5]QUM81395.1 hypothetical protein HWV01_14420 [Moritella sp. 5]
MDVELIKSYKALIVSVLRTTKNNDCNILSEVEDKFLLLDPKCRNKVGGVSLTRFPDTIFPVLILERDDDDNCKVRPLSNLGCVDKLSKPSGNYIMGDDSRFTFFIARHPIPIYEISEIKK